MSCSNKVIRPTKGVVRHLKFKSIRPYENGDLIQSFIANRHLESRRNRALPIPSQVILSFEFESVYTGGRREKARDHQVLKSLKNAPFIQTSRGGEVTYHGPGQLVVYPIINLTSLKLKSKCYIDTLERSVKRTLSRFLIDTVDSTNTGVWVNATTKISSIGVNIQRSITSHGVSLNNDPDLSYFNDPRLVICGLPGTTQTSIAELVAPKQEPTMEELRQIFVDDLSTELGFAKVETYEVDESIDEGNVEILDRYLANETD